MADRTVAVTGATGFVGRYVVRQLLSEGFAVRALVRDVAEAHAVLGRRDDLELVTGDVTDCDAASELVARAGACVHLVGIIREIGPAQTFERLHVQATDAIVSACEAAGLRRYIHMSALGVGAEGICEYQKTKWRAEQRVRSSSLDWTIFRPSLIHGPESEFVRMVAQWVRGHGVPGRFLPYFTRSVVDRSVVLGPAHPVEPVVAPVAVEDVAFAFVAALRREEAIGEVYNLAGPDRMRFPQMLLRFRDAIPGAMESIQPRPIPAKAAATAARVAKVLKLDSLLPFDEGMALMGARDSVAETNKAEAHLGLEPTPFQERLVRYAGVL